MGGPEGSASGPWCSMSGHTRTIFQIFISFYQSKRFDETDFSSKIWSAKENGTMHPMCQSMTFRYQEDCLLAFTTKIR